MLSNKSVSSASLTQAQRQRILGFGVSSAWADLTLCDQEVDVLFDIADELALDPQGRTRFLSWLQDPPTPEEVDPSRVQEEERALCLSVASRVIAADGRTSEEEEAFLALLKELLGPENRGFTHGVTQTSR
jgi:uncharacterized tellurite resistance protein B-like protein